MVVTVEEVQSQLRDLIAGLKPGEELLITDQNRTVARLVAERAHSRQPRQPGSAVGKLVIVSEDDDHLADFNEYLP